MYQLFCSQIYFTFVFSTFIDELKDLEIQYIASFGLSTSVLSNILHVWFFSILMLANILHVLALNFYWRIKSLGNTLHVTFILFIHAFSKLFLTSILILEGYQIHMQLICLSCLNYIWIKSLMYKIISMSTSNINRQVKNIRIHIYYD